MAYLGVEFEEEKYEQGDAPDFNRGQWENVKETLGFQFPNLPYLIDGRTKLTEVNTIMRYLANKYVPHLLGETPAEQGRVEMVQAQVTDLKGAVTMPCYTMGDRDAITNNIMLKIQPFIKFMGKHKFLTGNKVTYVDFTMFELCEMMQWISEGKLFEQYPTLESYCERVKALPGMAEFYADDTRCIKRPFNNKVAKLNN